MQTAIPGYIHHRYLGKRKYVVFTSSLRGIDYRQLPASLRQPHASLSDSNTPVPTTSTSSIDSITTLSPYSFTPVFKLSFSTNLSHRSLLFSSGLIPRTPRTVFIPEPLKLRPYGAIQICLVLLLLLLLRITVTSEHIRFLFLFLSFVHLLFFGSAR